MKICKCGCGEITITVGVNTCKRNNGKYDYYLRIYEPDFILGHSRRRVKNCKQCGIRIWKYCSKNQIFCSRGCQYKYQNEIGYLPVGENHSRWNGGKKATDYRQWIKKKNNPIVLNKIHKRLRDWYIINRSKQLLIHSISYKNNISIKNVSKEIVEEMLPFYEQYYKAKELLNDKSINIR